MLLSISQYVIRHYRLEISSGSVAPCWVPSIKHGRVKCNRGVWESGKLDVVDKGGGILIEGKQSQDLQTMADRKAEELIVSSLKQLYSNLAVRYHAYACMHSTYIPSTHYPQSTRPHSRT